MIRLLPKSEIIKAKSVERQKEIQDGLKITKSIDNLRETRANEESTLNKFRVETVKSIKEETAKLEEQRVKLVKEVKDLEEQKRILSIPLDKEWILVKEQEEALGKIRVLLESKTLELEQKERDIEKGKKTLKEEKNRISDERARIQDNLLKTSENLNQSKIVLKEAESKKELAIQFYDTKVSEALIIETSVLAKERDLDNRQKNLKRREKEIEIFNRQVNDKYQALLETQKRLK